VARCIDGDDQRLLHTQLHPIGAEVVVWAPKLTSSSAVADLRDALHHDKWQNFKTRDHNHALSLVICHPVARIDIAYLSTKFDFKFSRSSDVIGAPKIL